MESLIYPISGKYQKTSVDVSIVIPLYKSYRVVQEQIQRWTSDDDLSVEIIYVDDRCPDASKRSVFKTWNARRDRKKYLVKLVLADFNHGFGGACNLGVQYADGKHIVFLNADTIVTPNWIYPIVELLQDKTVGIVGNLQIKDGGEWHGSIDSAGSEWSWEQMNFMHIGRHIYHGKLLEKPFFPHDAPEDILKVGEREMVTGCCLSIRKELFEMIGGFNAHYRIGYWEDSEICLAARELGHKVMFQPNSVIYHKLHHTGSGTHPFATLNKTYFCNKWVDTQRIDPLVKAKRNLKPVKVRNILVKREAAHGDVMIAAAVLPPIRKKYPGAKVYFSTVCEEVLKGNPNVDCIIKESEIHKNIYQIRYDLDLAYERCPKNNILQAYAAEAGVPIKECELFLKQDPLGQELPGKYVVIHAGRTAWAGRNWHKERFEEIAKRVQAEGYSVVSVGRQGDHHVGDVDLRGATTIQQLAWVMARAKMFIGIDSMPMNVAQAMDTPGVCFFGCVRPETRILRGNMKGIVAKHLDCLGCHQEKPGSVATTECWKKTLDCENNVTVDDMWKEVLCCLNA